MSIIDNMRSRLLDWILDGTDLNYLNRAREIIQRRKYRLGSQREFLKPSRDGYNDNQITNYIGLIAERSVSMLFGKGIKFDFGETNKAQEGQEVQTPIKDYIDNVYNQNKKGEFLQRLAKNGTESGMCFCKIVPQPDNPQKPYRLIVLDSALMDIDINPYDMDEVEQYIYQYKTMDREGREMGVKEITRKAFNAEMVDGQLASMDSTAWAVELWENSNATNSKWELIQSVVWDYDFPPIVHWQNLINVGDAWGLPDLTADLEQLQDQYNFNASNRNKIIRYYAHPMRFSKMLGQIRKQQKVVVDGVEQTDEGSLAVSPGSMPDFNDKDGGIFQLEALGDLPAVLEHLEAIRQNMFETTRTVDVSTMKDKVGQLTNFGLKVIYQDSLQKMETKRELYGWGLKEINRRLLILSNMEEVECDLIWPDPLPENEQEEVSASEADLRMGIVSKQTISEKRGYTWEDEQKRMEDEQAANDNLGGALLRAFDKNGGINPERQTQQPIGR